MMLDQKAATGRASTASADRSPSCASPERAPLRLERAGGVATLVLDRPDRYNALSADLLAELASAFETLARDDALRCVVLAGAGRAFCAGHDLSEMLGPAADEAGLRALFAQCSAVMCAIRACPVPVIARVQGVATAAGCQLVAACDLAVAGRSARFAASGINLGLFCSTPAVALSRALPPKAAFEMLFTGRFIPAEEAAARGLLSQVVDDDALDAAASDLAAEICRKSASAVRLGKELFYRQAAMSLEDAYRLAGEAMARNMGFADARAGVEAFLGRTRPSAPGSA